MEEEKKQSDTSKQPEEKSVVSDNLTPGRGFIFPQRVISLIAEEVVKTVYSRLPSLRTPAKNKKVVKKAKKIENGIFLDTSAIIDGRIFEVIHSGLLNGVYVLSESILLELKHIADSQDMVRRERGKKGLEYLDKLKKTKGIKVMVVPDEGFVKKKGKKDPEVDERLIAIAKLYKGKIITCDYNLEKKASIQGVTAINMNGLAHILKITAVPGEAVHIKVQHPGKDSTQGVGYLDDGTMIVVENGREDVGTEADVVVSRVIQTSSGRILFAKKI